jgi:putative MATE family efflux protein
VSPTGRFLLYATTTTRGGRSIDTNNAGNTSGKCLDRRLDRRLVRPIFSLATPVALSSQLDTLVGVADIYLFGHLGADAISAVGISQILTMVVGVVMIAVSTGAFALVAQATGANDPRTVSATTKQALVLVALVSIGLSFFGVAGARLALELLSMPAAVVELGTTYLHVFFAGLVFMTLNFTLNNCLYGAGDARTPLYLNIFMSLLKVGLSCAFIFGIGPLPALGVMGAALATVLSRAVGFSLSIALIKTNRLKLRFFADTSFVPEKERAQRMLRIGIPSAIQGIFRNGSGLVFVKLVALTANPITAVAAFSIGNQVERIVRRTSLAFGTAATTLVGQRLGAGDKDEAERCGWTAMVVGSFSMAIFGAPLAFFADHIMGIFTQDSAIIEVGVVYIWAIVLAEPLHCLAITAGGGLRGAGDTKPALYYTVIGQWLVRLPVGYALAFHFGYDIEGLWFSLIAFSALQGWLTARKFALGEWKEREL